MPWWSWVLIWCGLALALLAMLALLGMALFRKLMTLVDALGALGQRVAGATDDRGHEESETVAAAFAVISAGPAVFQSQDRLAEVVADRRFEQRHRRQERRDRAIRHGKLFGTVSAIPKDSSHA